MSISKERVVKTINSLPKNPKRTKIGKLKYIQKLKKGNLSLILASFIQKTNSSSFAFKESKHKDCESSISIEVILKDELSKSIVSRISMNSSTKIISKNEERDIQKIKLCLIQIKGIAKYLKFNDINDCTFMKAIGYMNYEYYEANTYIFRQGESSDKFFGIISGHVSIRAKKIFKKTKIVSNSIERELTVFGPGMCLGEWGIIYSIPRTASAFTLTNTALFSMDKDAFAKTLANKIIKSDQDKKAFVANRIPHLLTVNKYQNILTQIVPLFFDNNNVVYTEFDKAEYLYVLYQGECIMTKFLRPEEKIEDIISKRDKMITLLKIDRGGILGLETINPNSKYSTNIIVTRDFTVLYRIKLDFLKECNILILRFLRSMYRAQQELILNYFQREINLISKRKHDSITQKRSISAENILVNKITGLIHEFTQVKIPSKRTINLKIKQKTKISFYPLFKRSHYQKFRQSLNKPTKENLNRVNTPVMFLSSTNARSRNKSQMSLIKITKDREVTKEDKCENDMLKINRLINTFYSRNNQNLTRLASYNSGKFDLPLVGI